ncbi:MAG: aldehyde reductase [Pseudomonadota bacterium]
MTKVFVTGASGFIAKHIVSELLDKGYAVRAGIRSQRRKIELQNLFPDAGLEFALLDLMQDDGWHQAMQGCDILMHTASPLPLAEPKDPQELIRPAVDGTMRALRAAKAAGITRVILTSSNVAMYKDPAKPIDQPSDESNWTDPEDPTVVAYEASKTLAERAAWDFVANNPEMELTTINPGMVFGPPLDAHFSTSLEIVERLMSGKDPLAPPMQMPIVDVRDVAMLHVAAIDHEAATGERYAATAGTLRFIDLCQALKAWDPSLKIARKEAPVWLLRLIGLFVPEARSITKNVGRNLSVSGSKAETAFNFKFIPAEEALLSAAQAIRAAKAH